MNNSSPNKIKVNRAKCLYCGWIIESQSDYHLNICGCGKFSVDGGAAMLRRYGNNFEELSEYEQGDID